MKESEIQKFKILHLNLNIEPFMVMVSGEKKLEYRENKKHWISRFFNKDGSPKHFDFIKFSHAYNPSNPYFYCKYEGMELVSNVHIKYSTGFSVDFDDERWAIRLGEIVFIGNM